RFAIASGSKAFTAVAVMRLVEDGLLDLDAPVREALNRDRAGNARSDGEFPLLAPQLSVWHLLTHTGGLEDYLDESDDSDPDDFVLAVFVHRLTTAEAFDPLLASLRQICAPGSGFAYSNAGYIILAIIIVRLTHQDFQDAVTDLV